MDEVAKYGDGMDILTSDMIYGYSVVFQRTQNSLARVEKALQEAKTGDLRDGIYPWHRHPLVLAQ
jgi:hypothetical protein